MTVRNKPVPFQHKWEPTTPRGSKTEFALHLVSPLSGPNPGVPEAVSASERLTLRKQLDRGAKSLQRHRQ